MGCHSVSNLPIGNKAEDIEACNAIQTRSRVTILLGNMFLCTEVPYTLRVVPIQLSTAPGKRMGVEIQFHAFLFRR